MKIFRTKAWSPLLLSLLILLTSQCALDDAVDETGNEQQNARNQANDTTNQVGSDFGSPSEKDEPSHQDDFDSPPDFGNDSTVTDKDTLIVVEDDDTVVLVLDDSTKLAIFLYGKTSRKWNVSWFTIEGRSGNLPCRLDDQMTLFSDGSYLYQNISTPCFLGEPMSEKGKWRLDFFNRKLVFDDLYEANIVNFGGNKIQLKSVYKGGFIGDFDIEGLFWTTEIL